MVSETQIKTRWNGGNGGNGGVFKQTRNPQVKQNLGTNSCRKGRLCIRFWEKKQGQLLSGHTQNSHPWALTPEFAPGSMVELGPKIDKARQMS